MRRVIVQYKVKPGRAAENEALIKKVFEELEQSKPGGLRYASFKQDDGVSFVHIASIETEDGDSPLDNSAAFKAFQAGIRDRCEEPPVAIQLNGIGSYKFFDS
jgi:quinol monooxygenase YgiN